MLPNKWSTLSNIDIFLMNETLQKLIDGHINILYPIIQITYL